MRAFFSRYEMEIRLGLVVIVVLLLILNFSSTYVLHGAKRKLAAEIDLRLSSCLNIAILYLMKNETDEIAADQIGLIKQRFGIDKIDIFPMSQIKSSSPVQSASDTNHGMDKIPRLNDRDMESLNEGDRLFKRSEPRGLRYGMALASIGQGRKLLVVAYTQSWLLDLIESASRKTFFLAAMVLLLIIPLTISLPRLILRPFKKMREAARSAGRLSVSENGDEVTEVIKTYENIINELKMNEAELKLLYQESSHKADRLEKLNKYILKSIGSGVINVDLTGKVIGYNRAAVDILSYDEDEVVDKHYLIAFPRHMELSLLIEAGLIRGEAVGNREIEVGCGTQSSLWLSVQSSLIFDDNGRCIGVTLLLTDITELKKLHSELEIKRRMADLGEMTGGLAHQLRNSLAAISGFCQLMQKKTAQNDELNDLAVSIRSEAASSETMVSRFLNFSRPLSLNKDILDLRDLLSDCMRKCLTDANCRNIKLNLNYPHEETSFIGDGLLLKEAIGNLLDNAIEAVDKDGRVEITLHRGHQELDISIADTGPGIPDKIKNKIFTPFFSSKPSGTGLGLALTQKIISLHKGRIALEQNMPHGTTCRIILPDLLAGEPVPIDLTSAEAKKV